MPPLSDRPAGPKTSPGGLGQFQLEVPLCKVRSAGGTAASAAVVARLVNPSRKLGCSFQIHFEPTDVKAVSSFGTSTWSPRAFDPNGARVLHFLEEAEELPRLYEMETFVPGVLIAATLGLPVDSTPATVPGTWVLRARWEPSMPMCEADASALYGLCSITRDSTSAETIS